MLYVTRHGQTVWNAQNKVCGITDIELTPKGREQALELANVPIEMDERLIEQNYGIYEGVDRKNEAFLAQFFSFNIYN